MNPLIVIANLYSFLKFWDILMIRIVSDDILPCGAISSFNRGNRVIFFGDDISQ